MMVWLLRGVACDCVLGVWPLIVCVCVCVLRGLVCDGDVSVEGRGL